MPFIFVLREVLSVFRIVGEGLNPYVGKCEYKHRLNVIGDVWYESWH